MHSMSSVYMSKPISQLIPLLPSPLVFIYLVSMSQSVFLLCNKDNLYHLSRLHIYALICICFSDLLHSVWWSLDPSTSLQMAQFCSFLWLSNIPLYICTISSLSIHLLTFTLLSCLLAIVNSAAMNIGMYVYFGIMIFSGYMPRSGIARSYSSSIFSF